jgi:serine protease Do
MPTEQQASVKAPAAGQSERVGIGLAALTDEMRNQLGVGASTAGVVVAEVKPGSKAAESSLRQGVVILGFGTDKVATPNEAVSKIHEAQAGHKKVMPVLVLRDGNTLYLALEVA